MRRLLCIWLSATALYGAQAQTLDQCQQAAERNYPLIQRMDLISKTTELTVSNIQKGWLPQLSASAQATWQSDVTAFPDQMHALYQQAGITMEGLKKDQYRVGINIDQTLFDGGAISSQKEVARQQGNVEAAQNEVSLYMIRKRVNELYFALLLLDDQIQLNSDLQQLLTGNEKKFKALFDKGAAAECDYLSVKAERLKVEQQATSLKSQRQTVERMLSVFCGMEVTSPVKPEMTDTPTANNRPELRLYDAQLRMADAQERLLDTGLLPRLSVFASGFYGYPGYNMFEDMMHRRWSLNGMVGARLTWNIGALYTRKNDKAKLRLLRETTENNREVFLFNNRLEQIQQNEDIARYKQLMAEDSEIIRLRSAVRKAAESKLAHGIIDANELVREINQENAAKVQLSTHEIEMLKQVYDQKFTTNN